MSGGPTRKTGELRAFYEPRVALSILTVALQLVLCAALIWVGVTLANPWLYPLLAILIGTRQLVLGEVLTHESSHHNLSRSKVLNYGLGYVCAWSCFHTVDAYWRYHKQHHDLDVNDPENNIHELYKIWGLPAYDQPLTRGQAFWHLVLKPITGAFAVKYYLIGMLKRRWLERRSPENVAMCVLWSAALVAMGFAGLLDEFLVWWFVPYLFVYAPMMFWTEVGEHYRSGPAGTRSHVGWLRHWFLMYGAGYHGLHHKYPGIPCFNLKAAEAVFKDEVQEQLSPGWPYTFIEQVRLRS